MKIMIILGKRSIFDITHDRNPPKVLNLDSIIIGMQGANCYNDINIEYPTPLKMQKNATSAQK